MAHKGVDLEDKLDETHAKIEKKIETFEVNHKVMSYLSSCSRRGYFDNQNDSYDHSKDSQTLENQTFPFFNP